MMTPILRKPAFYLFVIAALVAVVSCKKNKNEDTPATPSARLFGTVQTWDDKLNQIDDKSGITVSISNAGDSVVTTTDATGRFEFKALPFGAYNLVFSKAGYGTTKILTVSHTYNASQDFTQVPDLNFGKLATTAITRLSYYDSVIRSQPGIRLRYGFTPGPSASRIAYARYFLGTDSTVSNMHYTVADTLLKFSSYSVRSGYTFSELKTMGFTAGQTVYIRLYGDSYYNNSYVDSATGKRVFPNVNPTSPKPVPVVVR